MSTTPRKFYHNLGIKNTTPSYIPAKLEITRQSPLMLNPEEYEIADVRWETFVKLPLFIPTIISPPFGTDMSITLGFSGVFAQQFVQATATEVKNGYFSKSPFLEELNAAAAAAFAALPGGYSPLAAPYFWWNPDTQLVNMFLDSNYIEGTANTITIYFNTQLQSILNLPADIGRPPPNAFGLDFVIRVQDNAKVVPAIGSRSGFPFGIAAMAGTILDIEQEFIQPNNWVGLERLILSSTQIPFVPEFLSESNTPGQNASTTNNSLPVLADFSLAGLDQNDLFIQFLPTAEFRRISMFGAKPLETLDLQVYYTTFDGTLHELLLPPGGDFNTKILFERVGKR